MTTTFKICGVPEHFNAPWHIAQQEGKFEEAGINVEWQVEAGGTGAMCKALNSGESDLAVLLTEGVYADIAKGSKNKIVAVYVSSPLCWGIHSSAGKHHDHIKDVQDLKGSRYAISRLGSGSHLM
jgi:ABC-type nitrate/sulfonate/bicarbonate transport system substrate-binding protein